MEKPQKKQSHRASIAVVVESTTSSLDSSRVLAGALTLAEMEPQNGNRAELKVLRKSAAAGCDSQSQSSACSRRDSSGRTVNSVLRN